MKILKIQLQNINSLKSEQPIVIDFEEAKFKDIGLFAITGPTGAGKTTILDAIMIALYHKVPRLKTQGQTGLEMVVSYGAKKAFVMVDFENNGTRYQAHWDVIKESKTGKDIKPKHTFSIRNLSEEVTLQSRTKSEVLAEIQDIISLSAEQFLRSVLLAQGEFSAFLKAKGPEKASLLEQITGEEIYKRISIETQKRLSEETEKLKALQLKINTEDLIPVADKEELWSEEKQLKEKVQAVEKELVTVDKIINWYENQEKITAKKEVLTKDISVYEHQQLTSKDDLVRLANNTKAEPFRGLLEKSTEQAHQLQEIKDKSVKINNEFTKVNKTLGEKKCELSVLSEKLTLAKADVEKWEPVLDEVTELDKLISNKKSAQSSKRTDYKSIEDKLKNTESEHKDLVSKKSGFNDELKAIKKVLDDNAIIPEVEKHYADWQTQLSSLKDKKEVVLTEKGKLSDNQTKINTASESIKKGLTLQEKSQKALFPLQDKLAGLSELMAVNNLEKLYETTKLNQSDVDKWTRIEGLSKEYLKSNTELVELKGTKIKLENQQNELIESLTQLSEKQKTDKELYDKSVKIWEQQKLIQKYEKDRLTLEKGEECYLCGSKEHPFVSEYKMPELSETEKEVKEKESVLNDSIKNTQNKEKELALIAQEIKTIDVSIHKITELQNDLNQQVVELENGCDILAIDTISNQLKILQGKKVELEQSINTCNALQKEKDELDKQIRGLVDVEQEQKSSIIGLEKTLEALKSNEAEINDTIQKLTEQIDSIEKGVSVSLNKFKITLPKPEQTESLLSKISTRISTYNTNKEIFQDLNQKLSVVKTSLESSKKQQEDLNLQKESLQKEGVELSNELDSFNNQRVEKLPLIISVAEKRKSLQDIQSESERENQKLVVTVQSLEKQETELSTQVKEYKKQSGTLSESILNVENQINELLNSSDFTDVESIKKALLSAGLIKQLEEAKKQLDDKGIELTTRENQLKEELSQLMKQKIFEDSKEEAEHSKQEFKTTQSVHQKRLGEITQQLKSDELLRDKNKELVAQQDAQQLIVDKWSRLYSLLGGSKTAFNTYVQRITLNNLLNKANVHLLKLNKRYSLYMAPEYEANKELEFEIIDHYQTDQKRAIETTSGGEKFLISLALALGLADLTSKNMSIDSLFIDEGFGTLDQDSLASAMHTLETLQSSGKMIGIISHVENLKERIPTQIQITKKSNGVSSVEVVAVG